MTATGLSSATCMLCSGRPNCWHLNLRSTCGLLGGGAAASDDELEGRLATARDDEALLGRLKMPMAGGAEPKEKGLGEGVGASGGGSSGIPPVLVAKL